MKRQSLFVRSLCFLMSVVLLFGASALTISAMTSKATSLSIEQREEIALVNKYSDPSTPQYGMYQWLFDSDNFAYHNESESKSIFAALTTSIDYTTAKSALNSMLAPTYKAIYDETKRTYGCMVLMTILDSLAGTMVLNSQPALAKLIRDNNEAIAKSIISSGISEANVLKVLLTYQEGKENKNLLVELLDDYFDSAEYYNVASNISAIKDTYGFFSDTLGFFVELEVVRSADEEFIALLHEMAQNDAISSVMKKAINNFINENQTIGSTLESVGKAAIKAGLKLAAEKGFEAFLESLGKKCPSIAFYKYCVEAGLAVGDFLFNVNDVTKFMRAVYIMDEYSEILLDVLEPKMTRYRTMSNSTEKAKLAHEIIYATGILYNMRYVGEENMYQLKQSAYSAKFVKAIGKWTSTYWNDVHTIDDWYAKQKSNFGWVNIFLFGGTNLGNTISYNNLVCPSTITQGNSFELKGTITSSTYPIVRVECVVYDATTEKSALNVAPYILDVGVNEFDIEKTINYNVKFGKLPVGSYIMCFYTTDSKGNDRWSQEYKFDVVKKETSKPQQTIVFTEVNYPTVLTKGDEFQMTCVATASLYPIKTMRVDFINVDTGAIDYWHDMTFKWPSFVYDVSTSLNLYTEFKKLNVGRYYMKYTAYDTEGGTATYSTPEFSVVSETGDSGGSTTIPGIPAIPSDVMVKQQTNYTCTLASAVMVMRYAAYLLGDNYTSITESAVRPVGWLENEGLYFNFSYGKYRISCESLRDYTLEEKRAKLIQLLKDHPEGIALYNGTDCHCVWLVGYSDGEFYCVDPANSVKSGVILLSDAYKVRVSNSTQYWYLASPDVPATNVKNEMSFADVNVPSHANQVEGYQVHQLGKTFEMKGTVTSTALNITKLTCDIISVKTGQTILSGSVNTNSKSVNIQNTVNLEIPFEKLAEGEYCIRYTATDANGGTESYTTESFAVLGIPSGANIREIDVDEYNNVTIYWNEATNAQTYGIFLINAEGTLHDYINSVDAPAQSINLGVLDPGTYMFELMVTNHLEMLEVYSTATRTIVIGESAHQHTVENIPAVEATCKLPGNTAGEQCSICGHIISGLVAIPAKGHDLEITPEVKATCTTAGNTAGIVCKTCGEVLSEYQEVAALGHNTVIDEAIPATTTSSGLTEGSHCDRCGVVFKEQSVIPMIVNCKYGDLGTNLKWFLNLDTGELTISGEGAMEEISRHSGYYNYGGSGYYNDDDPYAYTPWYTYRASIKSVLIEEGVTSISKYTFSNCENISSVSLPESLLKIGDYAFYSCDSLLSIIIPDSVTDIGSFTFYCCNKLTNVKLSNSMTAINGYAFYYCDNLSSIIIPENITSIGSFAFASCYSLTRVSLPTQLNRIKNNAFGACTSLTVIDIPDSVTTIEKEAFYNCSGLVEIILPDNIGTIFEGAFGSCKSLLRVELPKYLVTIEDKAFEGCTSLTSITLPENLATIGNNAFKSCTNLINVVFSNGLASIGEYAFSACRGLRNVTLPEGLSTMGNYAFNECTSLKSISLPSTLVRISDYAFNGCTNLTEINFSEGLSAIGTYAFSDCTALRTVTLPEGLASMGAYVFNNCSGLQTVTLPDSLIKISSYAFNKCSSLTTVNFAEGLNSIEGYAFSECTGLRSITLPEGLASMGTYIFNRCSSLRSVTLPSSLTKLSNYAFNGCTSLTEVNFKKGLSYVGSYTFTGCTALRELVLPEGLVGIDTYAFNNCGSLRSITLPESLFSIASYAFNNCRSLNNVVIPKDVVVINDHTFLDCTGLTKITLPEDLMTIGDEAFRGCTGIRNIDLPDGISSIGKSAFYGCSGLTSVVLPANLTHTSEAMFSYCTSLSTVTLPEGLISIGGSTFYECPILRSINIPEGLVTIYAHAFYNCRALRRVQLPEGITKLGSYCFYGCTTLTEINLPDSLIGIGNNAFENCSSLKSVVIPEQIQYLNSYTFRNCTSMTSVQLPASLLQISESALYGCSSLTRINLPNTLQSVGYYAFDGCSSLVNVEYDGTASEWNAKVSHSWSYNRTLQKVITFKSDHAHSYDIKNTDSTNLATPANCTDAATYYYSCSCGSIGTETFEYGTPKGHTEVKDAAIEATCTKVGKTEGKHCSVCGEITVAQEAIPAKGHTLGEWITESEPSVGVEGKKQQSCTVCGYVLNEEVIPALPEETETESEVESESKTESDSETTTELETTDEPETETVNDPAEETEPETETSEQTEPLDETVSNTVDESNSSTVTLPSGDVHVDVGCKGTIMGSGFILMLFACMGCMLLLRRKKE